MKLDNTKAQMRKGVLELCILSIISEGEAYPSDIIKLSSDRVCGIILDTGGITLKDRLGIIGMKYDMCGAATVMGVMQAVAELELPINLIGVCAAAVNMPGSDATCDLDEAAFTERGLLVNSGYCI